ncbi:hypothetical protein CDV36_015203 [Fusarium kuroshium]|uniref:Uncharacterized protein n=2 Tax=Fusarium solani species complex TaxID=232080 RepID=A0A3M2RDS8_9HYPO|nr:hypothetical protein CDV36_015203 [Fusarium kuroshium]RSL40563.1 hypothetical protein CEP51_016682 [Fusarium floridanum]
MMRVAEAAKSMAGKVVIMVMICMTGLLAVKVDGSMDLHSYDKHRLSYCYLRELCGVHGLIVLILTYVLE